MGPSHYEPRDDGHLDEEARREYLRGLMRQFSQREDHVSRWVDMLPPREAEDGMRILHTWNYEYSRREPLFPTRLNVILTAPPDDGCSYAAWLIDRFDLAHCAVAVGVAPSTGAWRFGARPESMRALMDRRLVPTAHCFAGSCIGSVQRISKYAGFGFGIDGDGSWPDTAEAQRMLRRMQERGELELF